MYDLQQPDSEPFDDDDDEDEDEDSKARKKRSSRVKKSSKKATKVPTLKIKLGKRKRGSSVRKCLYFVNNFVCIEIRFPFVLQEEEGEGSGGGSDRDSDVEFEQMLQEANEGNSTKGDDKASQEKDTPDPPEEPRRKAKTKIGNKNKKRRKLKGSGKPGAEQEEQYEVSIYLKKIMELLLLYTSEFKFIIFIIKVHFTSSCLISATFNNCILTKLLLLKISESVV